MRLIKVIFCILISQLVVCQNYEEFYGGESYSEKCQSNKVSEIKISQIEVDASSVDTVLTIRLEYTASGYLIKKESQSNGKYQRYQMIKFQYDQCNGVESSDTFGIVSSSQSGFVEVPSSIETVIHKRNDRVFKTVVISRIYNESIASIVTIELEKRYFYTDKSVLVRMKETVYEDNKLTSETEIQYSYENDLIKDVVRVEKGSVRKTIIHFDYVFY